MVSHLKDQVLCQEAALLFNWGFFFSLSVPFFLLPHCNQESHLTWHEGILITLRRKRASLNTSVHRCIFLTPHPVCYTRPVKSQNPPASHCVAVSYLVFQRHRRPLTDGFIHPDRVRLHQTMCYFAQVLAESSGMITGDRGSLSL